MLEVDVGQANAQLSDLVKAVERGETFALVRDGMTIAQVVPTPSDDPEERKKAFERFMKNRKPLNLTWQELYSWRHVTSNPCQE